MFAIVCPDRPVGAGSCQNEGQERLYVVVCVENKKRLGRFASKTVAQACPSQTLEGVSGRLRDVRPSTQNLAGVCNAQVIAEHR